MRPRDTLYRLAKPNGEWNRIYSLARREGFGVIHPGWPTVVAVRAGRIVGFLTTHDRDDVIVAGPLVIEGGRNMLMFLRLGEAYENVLRIAGVNAYLLTVDKGNFQQAERVQVLGGRQIGVDATRLWFRREI